MNELSLQVYVNLELENHSMLQRSKPKRSTSNGAERTVEAEVIGFARNKLKK